MIKFNAIGHLYTSIIPDNRKWTGITTLVGKLTPPFTSTPEKCSVRKPGKYANKWYGMSPEEIRKAWDGERDRSTDLGSWYHDKREQELYDNPTQVPVHRPLLQEGEKIAGDQKLSDGIYPEHLVYLESACICGQSDYVKVLMNRLYIRDYKTSKEIKRKGFETWEGEKMMLPPLQHLSDCEFYHYALQLSLYAYIILKHNPALRLQELVVEHVKFEIESEDKYGYPIYKRDATGSYIVKEIEEIELPYMSKEVQLVVNWLKEQTL